MRLRALIALPALIALGGCYDPYYDGYGPSGYVSGTYYGSAPVYSSPSYGSPGYYYDRRPDYRPDYRPRRVERQEFRRDGSPRDVSGGQTERDAQRFNRNRRGPEPGQ